MRLSLTLLALLLLTASTQAAVFNDSRSWTGGVYMAIVGDSLAAGGGAVGCGSSALPNAINTAAGFSLSITNLSVGGSHWTNDYNGLTATQNMYNQVTNALAASPRWVFIQCGRNNVWPYNAPTNAVAGYPDYWPVIRQALADCLSYCRASNALMLVGEILPAYGSPTESGATTVAAYNAQYGYWCATNSGTYVVTQHDAFGVGTGNNDLNPDYYNSEADHLHINQAAYTAWGPIIFNRLQQILAPLDKSAVTANVGTIRAP